MLKNATSSRPPIDILVSTLEYASLEQSALNRKAWQDGKALYHVNPTHSQPIKFNEIPLKHPEYTESLYQQFCKGYNSSKNKNVSVSFPDYKTLYTDQPPLLQASPTGSHANHQKSLNAAYSSGYLRGHTIVQVIDSSWIKYKHPEIYCRAI